MPFPVAVLQAPGAQCALPHYKKRLGNNKKRDKDCHGVWIYGIGGKTFEFCGSQGGPPWTGLVPANPTDARLDWVMGDLEAR